jgi:hypothetical protein
VNSRTSGGVATHSKHKLAIFKDIFCTISPKLFLPHLLRLPCSLRRSVPQPLSLSARQPVNPSTRQPPPRLCTDDFLDRILIILLQQGKPPALITWTKFELLIAEVRKGGKPKLGRYKKVGGMTGSMARARMIKKQIVTTAIANIPADRKQTCSSLTPLIDAPLRGSRQPHRADRRCPRRHRGR